MSVPVADRNVFGLDRRTVRPASIVAIVVAFFGAVIPAINHAVSPEDPIEPGTVLEVGLGVSFTPVAGWALNTDATTPGEANLPGVVGVSETGMLFSVAAEPFEGDLDEFMDVATDRRSEAVDKLHLTSPQQSTATSQGVTGLTETYNGIGVQGRLTVFVLDGVAVTVDADGPEGSLALHASEIDAMTATILFSEVER